MTLEEDHKQALDHITTLQERCNELLNNERGAKRALNNTWQKENRCDGTK